MQLQEAIAMHAFPPKLANQLGSTLVHAMHCKSSEPYPAGCIKDHGSRIICCRQDLRAHGCLGYCMRTSKIQSGLAGLMVSYKVSGLGLFIQSTPKIENCLKGFRVWASKGTSFYRIICTLWGPRAVLGQDAHLLEERSRKCKQIPL